MKSLLKKLLPALALTLMIAGTVAASVVNHKATAKQETTWVGVRDNNEEVPLDHQPSSLECDQVPSKICFYTIEDNNPPVPTFNGPYTGPGQ